MEKNVQIIYGIKVDTSKGFTCKYRKEQVTFSSYAEATAYAATHPHTCITYWGVNHKDTVE